LVEDNLRIPSTFDHAPQEKQTPVSLLVQDRPGNEETTGSTPVVSQLNHQRVKVSRPNFFRFSSH
jgi:hypothetical protein